MGFRVLFVCTANICRSPIAEAVFLRLISGPGRRNPASWRPRPASRRGGSGIEVVSVGTNARPNIPIDPLAATALHELGYDADAHVSTPITEGWINGADLILTATVRQRRSVLTQVPTAIRRTFTMREFARLGAALPPPGSTDLPARVEQVAARRGEAGPATEDGDDIADPFGEPLRVMQRCARDIEATVHEIGLVFGLAPATSRRQS